MAGPHIWVGIFRAGGGMEKSIRSSVASLLESPLPHTATASAAHASSQAGLHLQLHALSHAHAHAYAHAHAAERQICILEMNQRLVVTNHDLCPALPPTILYSIAVTFCRGNLGCQNFYELF